MDYASTVSETPRSERQFEKMFQFCERRERDEMGRDWIFPMENYNLLRDYHHAFGTDGVIKGFHWLKRCRIVEEKAPKVPWRKVRIYTDYTNLSAMENFMKPFTDVAFPQRTIIYETEHPA